MSLRQEIIDSIATLSDDVLEEVRNLINIYQLPVEDEELSDEVLRACERFESGQARLRPHKATIEDKES